MITQIIPWLADIILACRLLVVFPPRTTPKRKLLALFAFPVIVKSIRLAAVIVFFQGFQTKLRGARGNPLQLLLQYGYHNSPWTKVEWFLEIFDTGYRT